MQLSRTSILGVLAMILSLTTGFQVTVSPQRRDMTTTTALDVRRGRRSLQEEVGDASGVASDSNSKSSSGGGTKVRRDINWCPMPKGQTLPKEINKVGLLDTNLPTLKNSATNPTGAVSVLKADNSQIYCFSSACPSCQIPLTKAKVERATDTTAPHPRLVCDFCKATYSLKDGALLQGDDAVQSGGLFSGVVKNVFAAQDSGSL